MKLSIVVPCYNEDESLPELFQKLETVMRRHNYDYEYIFVDDGSTDRTVAVLREMRKHSDRVGIISFRRNYGKSAALNTAFRAVDGDVVITMDADLQDDPEEIPKLLAKLDEGADLVSGWKVDRKDPISKTLPSKIFNAVTSLVSGIRLHDFNCGLKAYRRDVVDTLTLYGELHRFVPVLAGWEGFKVDEIGVRHFKRKYGYSKFGARRFFNGFFDLITVMFVTRRSLSPLHLFGRIAIVLFTLGVLPQIFFLFQLLGGKGLHVRPVMLLGFVLIIVAIQIGSIGLLAEMITSRTAKESTYAFKEYAVRGETGPPRRSDVVS
ncbi:MAG: glycosyltransferase family 2 protein [bacterium]|nr:glycosyltransferase family 2 protein [bacterium]